MNKIELFPLPTKSDNLNQFHLKSEEEKKAILNEERKIVANRKEEYILYIDQNPKQKMNGKFGESSNIMINIKQKHRINYDNPKNINCMAIQIQRKWRSYFAKFIETKIIMIQNCVRANIVRKLVISVFFLKALKIKLKEIAKIVKFNLLKHSLKKIKTYLFPLMNSLAKVKPILQRQIFLTKYRKIRLNKIIIMIIKLFKEWKLNKKISNHKSKNIDKTMITNKEYVCKPVLHAFSTEN